MNGISWAVICGVVSVCCIAFLVRDNLVKRRLKMQEVYNKNVNATPVLKSFLLGINSELDWACFFNGKKLKFFIPDLDGQVFVEFNLEDKWDYTPGYFKGNENFARVKELITPPEYITVSENIIRDVCSVAYRLHCKLDGEIEKLKINRIQTAEMLGFCRRRVYDR